jgi:hypothetical protein
VVNISDYRVFVSLSPINILTCKGICEPLRVVGRVLPWKSGLHYRMRWTPLTSSPFSLWCLDVGRGLADFIQDDPDQDGHQDSQGTHGDGRNPPRVNKETQGVTKTVTAVTVVTDCLQRIRPVV